MLSRRVSTAVPFSQPLKSGFDGLDLLTDCAIAMEQVGIQLVSSLAQSVTTVVSQGLPMMMGRMMGAAPPAAAPAGNKQKRKAQKGGQKAGSLSQSDIAVPDASDPGYQAAIISKEPINLLAAILGIGTDKGVDWEKFSSTSVNSKGGVTFINTMINHTLKSTQWTEGPASIELKESLEKLHTVCLVFGNFVFFFY